MNNKTLIIKRVVLSFLSALMIGFIFYNSSLDATDSSTQSFGVLTWVNNFFSSLKINIVFSENFVRKCAHFVEYFILGVLLFFTASSYVIKPYLKILLALGTGLVTASIDETIQLFSFGRSAQLTDVLLDFCGVCTAVLILSLIINNRKTKTDRK